ncbi:hypothetical protein CTEN210_11475 [Chaetoceros tenuissimus]|uniref:F-box domain-containing protein n=1 Tax=Chaetoceros tenuissimus TaxID=426638 RepID=A0AAD3CZT5_9STRA|nr:hypothetical protein CTEN210_11475 [Chaetoceros tenuissimus]
MTSEPERKKARTDHKDSLTVVQDRVKELQDNILALKEEYPELEYINQSRLHSCLDEAFVKYKSEQSKLENDRHCPLYKLPNEILQKCFEFVGDKSYLFTALVSKKFHEAYKAQFDSIKDEPWFVVRKNSGVFTSKFVSKQKTNNGKLTSYRYGACSTSSAKYCVETCCKTQDEKDQIFIAGAVNGNIEILEYALEEGHDLLPIIAHSSLEGWENKYEKSGIARIAKEGHLHVLKHLYEKVNFRMGVQLASYGAIGIGRLDIIEWLDGIDCFQEKHDGDFCAEASSYGHVYIFKWLIERGYNPAESDQYNILKLRDREFLDYCLSEEVEFEEYAINSIADAEEDVEFAEYCQEKGLKMTPSAYFNAIKSGSLEMVKFLHRSGIPWNDSLTADAVQEKEFDILKFARENNCPWHPKTSSCAAECCDLKILQYLHTHGCPWHPDTFKKFILGEKPTAKVFRFLHENGCPWDKYFSWSILRVESISLLQCLHESGLPYENDLLALALNFRWFDGVKYIIESEMKCERPTDLGTVIAPGNFECHNFEILKYLKSTGMEWGSRESLDDMSALILIASSCKFDDKFEVFKWAIESGYPFDERYDTLHILTGHFHFRLDVMKYLLSKNCPGAEYCFEYAIENQQVEIVKFLYESHDFKQRSFFDMAFREWFKDPSNQQKREILAYLQRQGCPQSSTFDDHDYVYVDYD